MGALRRCCLMPLEEGKQLGVRVPPHQLPLLGWQNSAVG
jgi:hypothetical protein